MTPGPSSSSGPYPSTTRPPSPQLTPSRRTCPRAGSAEENAAVEEDERCRNYALDSTGTSAGPREGPSAWSVGAFRHFALVAQLHLQQTNGGAH